MNFYSGSPRGDSKDLFLGADDFLDYQEVVHVFLRGSAASRTALYQVGQSHRIDHSLARLSDEERAYELVPRVRGEPSFARGSRVSLPVSHALGS